MARDDAPRVVRREDHRPPAWLVDRIDLVFDLDPVDTRVTSRLSFRRNPAGEGGPLVLDGERQDHVGVRLDGVPLAGDAITFDDGGIAVASPPERGVLEVESTIHPAANTALEGLYVSGGFFCTQCEPEGFRRITYFPDRPDVLSRYRVRIVADRARYPVLLSNGNLVSREELAGGRHAVTWEDPFPKPSYLFALVAGDLACLDATFVTRSGREIALKIYSSAHNLPRCTHAMASLQRAMRWDEDRFGLEYDLDTFMIFSADDFNMGAMENKGLNVFNSKLLLASADTATDADYQRIEAVIGHEYFHNWTGNRVTCRDWFQLSLKEGLTVFRDQEFSADTGSRAVRRIEAVQLIRAQQFAEDAGPMSHPVRPDQYAEINNFYTATVYEKGAEVIRMQHTLLGEEAFRRGIDLYFARHDGQAVTCDDFVQAMQDASGIDLGQFKRWYSQAGTPIVDVRDEYDPVGRSYTLVLSQSCPPTPGQPVKLPMHVPFAVGLLGADGRDLPASLEGEAMARDAASAASGTHVLQLREIEQRFRFTGVGERPVPSLLRGFSAPVKLRYEWSDEALLRLAAHDSDPVGRWDAAQTLYSKAIRRLMDAHRGGGPMQLDAALVRMGEALLADVSTDPALRAMALAIPEIGYLVEQYEAIDLDALIAAREFVERELARALAPSLAAGCAPPVERYDYEPVQVARRCLARECLRLLAALDDSQARRACVAHYRASTNMTDTMSALLALNDTTGPEREEVFGGFARRWADEPLVLDKWFALEASTRRADALERVQSCMRHPVFDPRNPNRVRALIGTFAARNWHGFHRLSGEGYRFVADEVLALDRTNPMIAARIVSAFNRWRRFDPVRAGLQRRELERIGAAERLSGDVNEIVKRALAT